MPASPITVLTDRRVLNTIVNMRINPYTALYNMLFPASVRETLFEEYLQVDVLTGTTGMAPFVKVGQKAIMVDSPNGTSYTFETPFINIKRPLTYSTRLAKRIVGGNVFVNKPGQILQIIKEEISRDVDYMNTLIDNRLEWLAAKALIGTIEYSVEGNDSFTISTGKPGGNTITSNTYWTTTCTPHEDIRTMKAVVAAVRGPIPNVGICGASAAAALRALILAGTLKLDTTSGIDIGRMNLISRIQEDGMIYMGRFCDIDFWEYLGTYADDSTGATTQLIRTNYIEFFSNAQSSVGMRKVFFGLIPDLKAILDGAARTERYMTSKAPDEDQGTYEGIIKSRPFPWFYRPDWQVSMKVVADA
jgi:hypothetical protein